MGSRIYRRCIYNKNIECFELRAFRKSAILGLKKNFFVFYMPRFVLYMKESFFIQIELLDIKKCSAESPLFYYIYNI